MNIARIVVLLIALGAGGFAAYLASGSGSVTKTPQIAPVAQLQTVDVLVAKADIGLGQTLKPEDVQWQTWPAASASNAFIRRNEQPNAPAQVAGSIVRVPFIAGEPIREQKLVKGNGSGFMAAILPSGMRAVATAISADTSAGGFILPNDFVDVIMTRRADASNGGAGFNTETILKNIRVLAIDQTIQEDEEGKKTRVGQTATLELTPQQAEIITVAQQMADRLTLALRSITDTQEKVTDEADYLVSGNGRKGTVRLIKSGEISEVGARK